jgi:IclR family KDG regulon transcriptional repressor
MPIIQSLDRALTILDLFDEHNRELKITEISTRLGLHKSTVHSLLKTLQLHGYIEQDANGLYRLGMRLLEKGQLVLRGLDIREIASGPLKGLSLETGQTVHLVLRDGMEGVYIDKVEGSKAAIRYSWIGRRVPLHSSAVGKVLTAFMSDAELERVLTDYDYCIHTAHTIASEAAFREELRFVREAGVAFDREENEAGVRCAAAPVYNYSGRIVAAISISTLISAVDDEELAAFVVRLRETAVQISYGLGYR